MSENYTNEQMELWGNVNLIIGATAITAVYFVTLLLGTTPLDWFWHGLLLVILVPVGYFYYRQYKQTKETEEIRPEPTSLTDVDK